MDQTNDATIVIVTKVTFDRSKEGDYTMSIEEIDNHHVSLPIMVLTQDMLSTFETPHEEYYNQLGYTKIQWKTAAALPPFIHKMQTTGYSGSEFKTLTGSAWLGEDDILKFADKCEIILIDLERESSASGPQKGSGKRTSKKKKRRSKKRKPTKKRKSSKKRKTAKKRRRN